MPTLSIFFGIVIRMFYDDHPPPRRALGLVLDWAELHQHELRDNWVRGQEHDALSPIAPLE